MSQILNLPNFDQLNIVDHTQLTTEFAAGVSSITVDNTNDFSTNGFILLGTIGSKNAEMIQAGTVAAAGTVPLATATKLPHNQYEDVYQLFGDQLKVYRAANVDGTQPADTAFAPIGSPVTIDPNDTTTSFTDSSGGGNYWYKYTHFNSVTSAETDLASATARRGNFTVDYCSVGEVREEAGFKNAPYVSDDQIYQKIQAAQDEINSALDEFYAVPLQPPIPDNLKQICIVLAAGYLRKAQFSAVTDTAINGQDKIDWAELEIDKLVVRERELMTKDGKSLAEPGGAGQTGGWPDQTTATADPSQGGAPRYFRMSDIQGTGIVGQDEQYFGNVYQGRRW